MALSQCTLWISIGYVVDNFVLRHIGKNTMIIYLTHPIFIAMWTEFGFTNLPKTLNVVCLSVFAMAVGLLLGVIIERFCPVLVGKKDRTIRGKM